mmetsp:Transcript_60327/g.99561  ORF Transcript_60327/g.99561 Transcript_60327/m.99561 type:complete len:154 (-) Transcript_60327:36-497(-)
MLRAPEVLFRPNALGVSGDSGVDALICDSIAKCNPDIREQLWNNIVLNGGNTIFEGFPQRLLKELNKREPDRSVLVDAFVRRHWTQERLSEDVMHLLKRFASYKCNVVAPPERKYSAWLGGSILASLSSFDERWITKEEYDETGPSIVNKKCL